MVFDNRFNISYIKLFNFRNYRNFELDTLNKSILISGANGTGKTSILEAISLLFPGKGMRNASIEDMKHNFVENWAINAIISVSGQEYSIKTGLVTAKNNIIKRITKINDNIIKSQSELLKYFNVLWLTPQNIASFLYSSSNRRKFLDRMRFNFDNAHASRIAKYEKMVKERSNILKMPNLDEDWITVIEQEIARLNVEIYKARVDFINLIEIQVNDYKGDFPKLKLRLNCNIGDIVTNNVDGAVEIIMQKLKQNRHIDKMSSKTNLGSHRADFELYHFDSNRHIDNCSTGEQKSMFVSMIIFTALAKAYLKEPPPVLLLDEIMTHLDIDKKASFINLIDDINMQAWITGTDQDLWNEIKFPAKALVAENAGVFREDSVA